MALGYRDDAWEGNDVRGRVACLNLLVDVLLVAVDGFQSKSCNTVSVSVLETRCSIPFCVGRLVDLIDNGVLVDGVFVHSFLGEPTDVERLYDILVDGDTDLNWHIYSLSGGAVFSEPAYPIKQQRHHDNGDGVVSEAAVYQSSMTIPISST